MQQINEVFDQLPYDYTMGKNGSADIHFIFTESESGNVFRIQFYGAAQLGKNVRRVFIGERAGEKTFRNSIKAFKNPLRVLATIIAATEDFLKTPVGMQMEGFALFLPKHTPPSVGKVLPRIFKRSKILKNKLNFIDTKFQMEERGYYLWAIRKGKKPSDVFNGDAVRGVISDTAVNDDDGEAVVVVPPPLDPVVKPVVMPVAKRKLPTIDDPVGEKYGLNFAGLDEAVKGAKDYIGRALENKEIRHSEVATAAKRFLKSHGFTQDIMTNILEEEVLLTLSKHMRIQNHGQHTTRFSSISIILDDHGDMGIAFDIANSVAVVYANGEHWTEDDFASGILKFDTVLLSFVRSVKRVAAQFEAPIELAWYKDGISVSLQGKEILRKPLKVIAYNNFWLSNEWEDELREALVKASEPASDDRLSPAPNFTLETYEKLIEELETKFKNEPWDRKVQLLKDSGFTPVKLLDALHDALTIRKGYAVSRFTGYDYSDNEVYIYVGDRKVSIPYGMVEIHCTHRSPSSFKDFKEWYTETVDEFIYTIDDFGETALEVRALTFKSTEVVLEVELVGDRHAFSVDFSLAGVMKLEEYMAELAASDDSDIDTLEKNLTDNIAYCNRFVGEENFNWYEFEKFIKEFSEGSKFSEADAEDKTQMLLQEKTSIKVGVQAQRQIAKHLPTAMRLMGGKDALRGFKKDEARAYYSNNTGFINVGTGFDAPTLWHEYGHAVERASAWVHRMCKEMLISQLDICDDEMPINDLNKIRKSPSNRNSGEVALNDPFFEPYIGRLYLTRELLRNYERIRDKEKIKQLINKLEATEVLSMGFQYFCSPTMAEALFKRDPELFAFVVMVIRKLTK